MTDRLLILFTFAASFHIHNRPDMYLPVLILNAVLFFAFTWLLWAAYFKSGKETKGNVLPLLLVFVFVILNKFPVSLVNAPLNEDEAMNFAEGLALLKDDPVLWRSVDFFTIGPVHVFHFMIPGLLGFENDFINVRIVWLIITFLSFVFLYLACLKAFGKTYVWFAYLYPLLFFGFGTIRNLNHFTNESTGILLMAAGMFLLIRQLYEKETTPVKDLVFYFLMGLVPYAKLQGVPIALAMSLVYLISGLRKSQAWPLYFLTSAIQGLLPTILLLIYLVYFGQLDNFLNFYLFSNLSYGAPTSLTTNVFTTFLVRSVTEFPINYYLKHLYLLIFVFLLFLAVAGKLRNALTNTVVLLFAATIYAVSKPGFAYGHYFNYLWLTLPLGLGVTVKAIGTRLDRLGWSRGWLIALYLIPCLAVFAVNMRHYDNARMYREAFSVLVNGRPEMTRSETALELMRLKARLQHQPRMVVFDWWPTLYITTGITQAVHQNVPERLFGEQSSDSSMVNFSRKVFLEDMKKNKPEFFLLAKNTERSYYNFTYENLEKISPIKSYFEENYIFYKETDDLGIYIRKDLYKRLTDI